MAGKVYLSGPTSSDWRNEVSKKLEKEGVLSVNPALRVCGNKEESVKVLVEDDKMEIDSCDALLVNFQKPSPRVAMEILYAWERGKKIVVATGESHVFPWLEYHSHVVVKTLDEAVAEIIKVLGRERLQVKHR
ncbi:MAG: hypothetical protein HYU39_00355 [Thaumarchaeota archaeon]|nr:hypothetical protein [Nitrososphaerota archaeon]